MHKQEALLNPTGTVPLGSELRTLPGLPLVQEQSHGAAGLLQFEKKLFLFSLTLF